MSPLDALDPGDGSYPNWPRLPDGTPDPARMPTGLHRTKNPATGEWITIDLTNYDPVTGEPIVPPPIPPIP